MNEFPSGWDESRVRDLIGLYEAQTPEEAAAEHEAALRHAGRAVMTAPSEVVALREPLPRGEKSRKPH
jgi:hypothetical protein